jgi:putative DNA primase/helicase
MYNIFTGFPIEPVQGDVSAVHAVLRLIANNDEAVFNYIEKWVAWILQRPYSKTGTSIIIQGDQGIGKDTYFDFVGKMFGDYFFNTNRAEEDVFGKFNGHLKKILLMKFEEASFLVNKKNESSLKSLITCNRQAYENKGIDPITLDNYFNIIMTTNNEIPVHIEQTDRRFVLIKGSNERRGDLQFWNGIHDQLSKPETLQAYMDHLLRLDLTNFNPRDRPITEYYEEVKQAFIPYHARYFQRIVEGTHAEAHSWSSRTLFENVKGDNQKFDLTETKFGRDMKLYFDSGALTKVCGRSNNSYSLDVDKMVRFLHAQNWWIDY